MLAFALRLHALDCSLVKGIAVLCPVFAACSDRWWMIRAGGYPSMADSLLQ